MANLKNRLEKLERDGQSVYPRWHNLIAIDPVYDVYMEAVHEWGRLGGHPYLAPAGMPEEPKQFWVHDVATGQDFLYTQGMPLGFDWSITPNNHRDDTLLPRKKDVGTQEV